MWGYLIIGICIGMVLGALAAFYVAYKDAAVRGIALRLQDYCAEMDCFECEFMRKDGTCGLETPIKWALDKEE